MAPFATDCVKTRLLLKDKNLNRVHYVIKCRYDYLEPLKLVLMSVSAGNAEQNALTFPAHLAVNIANLLALIHLVILSVRLA